PQATIPAAQPAPRQEAPAAKPQMPAAPPPSAEPFGKPGSAAHIEAMVEGLTNSTPAPAAVKPRGKNGEARGWVADLLRRASSSESADAAQPDEIHTPGGR